MGLILVTGAGGFLGGHLIRHLFERGLAIRAVDCKPFENWIFRSPDVENLVYDLSEKDACYRVMKGVDAVYNFAADMGGMGFIENNKAACMLSVLINTHLLMAARDNGVGRFLFASSACVYPAYRRPKRKSLGCGKARPFPQCPRTGMAGNNYSASECVAFPRDFGLQTRVAIPQHLWPFGNLGRWSRKSAGRDRRKVALAAITGRHEIEIWGDGQQCAASLISMTACAGRNC